MVQIGRKLRVCHVAATTDGATWMVEQLRELRDKKGYEVSAIISLGNGTLAKRLSDEDIPYQQFNFEFPSSDGWSSLPKRVLSLARIFRQERFDVVHTHLFASMVLGRLAAWLADSPVRLAMIAGPYHLEAYTPRWIDADTQWMETGLIASCEYTRNLYRDLGVKANRISVIYYGPDESKFHRIKTDRVGFLTEFELPESAKLIGMIAYFYPRLPAGRWTPEILHDRANKRQIDLIRAAPKIINTFPNAKILLVGSGWGEAGELEMERAKQLVEKLSLQESVIFTGYRSNVNHILSTIDLAVQASLSENLGGTIESLLVECPTIATRTGGQVDSIRNGETGFLVEQDKPDALADGVIQMLQNPSNAKRMAANGRQLMLEKFTLRTTVDDLDELYRSQMSNGVFGHRRGYHLSVSIYRMIVAAPVFSYLGARLIWDSKFVPMWHAGWRPTPIRQLIAIQFRIRSIGSMLRNMVMNGRANSMQKAQNKNQPTNREIKTVSQNLINNTESVDLSAKPFRRRMVNGIISKSKSATSYFSQLPPRISRFLKRRRRRIWSWSKLQVLFAYGYLRKILKNSRLLELWDEFFAWLRK